MGFYSVFIPVYAFLLLPILTALRGDTDRYLSRIAEVQWALMVCVFCISHVPALLTLNIPGYEGRNVLLIAFLVVVVQGSDVAQYIWGKLFGPHQDRTVAVAIQNGRRFRRRGRNRHADRGRACRG